MTGEVIEKKDYNTKSRRMQTVAMNTHFFKHFGRNDFKKLHTQQDAFQSVGYLMKHIKKSGEKLVFGGVKIISAMENFPTLPKELFRKVYQIVLSRQVAILSFFYYLY